MKKYKISLNLVLIVYVIIAILTGFQQYFLDQYNNFTIFQHSVFHFFNHQNLYLEYKKEYLDVFLYNPSFSLFFSLFAYFPTGLGITLWAVFITLVYFFGIISLDLKLEEKLFILIMVIPELNTSVANLQTNPIIVSFIILAMTSLQKKNYFNSAIYSAINFFIKGYGGIAYVFFLFQKPKFKLYFIPLVIFIAIFLLPLIFYSFIDFITLYKQWFWSLKKDYSINTGISIMSIIKSLIYRDVSIASIQMAGIIFFIASLVTIYLRKNYEQLKYLFLAYVLIWVIIFNQASESPTYIIASTGALIWFVKSDKTWGVLFLFVFFYILTVMSSSDLFPKSIRSEYIKPYSIKALPCVLIWILLQFKIFFPNLKVKSLKIWNKRLI